jgi:hypothetical protein
MEKPHPTQKKDDRPLTLISPDRDWAEVEGPFTAQISTIPKPKRSWLGEVGDTVASNLIAAALVGTMHGILAIAVRLAAPLENTYATGVAAILAFFTFWALAVAGFSVVHRKRWR